MQERFLVYPQLCFVVSFVIRVPGPEEGVIFSGKAWMDDRDIDLDAGRTQRAPGKRTLY